MGFPINKIVSAGTILKIGRISGVGNTPREYTLTAGAALANATSLSLTATQAVFIQHEEVLDFGDGVTATVNIPDGEGLSDGIQVGTTATTVPILPLETAISASDTCKTYALRQVLGISDASPTEAPQTTDTTDMKSGFGQSMIVTGVNRTITVSGFKVPGDRARYEILDPYLTDDNKIRELLWAELYLPNGDIRKGPCRITDAGNTNQVRNPLQYSMTLSFEGNIFFFIPGDEKLFNPPVIVP